jgi:nitroreductase
MPDLWTTIQSRRSIRRYDPLKEVPDEMILQILEAARLAPSGCNGQPWRFLVVRDKETRKEIRRLCFNQRFIEEAPVTILCFAVLDQYSPVKLGKEHWKQIIKDGFAQELSGDISNPDFWEGLGSQPVPSRDKLLTMSISNTFIAIGHLLLMATALGLGTCWVGVSDNPEVNRLLNVPDSLVLAAVVPLGYPAGPVPPQRPRISMEELLLKPLPPHS